uniref:Uncharacterized protein n=1 Tax=uncultured marine group II/III euryarchaeote KM3_87_G01 TaxID=1456533 RepID=A0A075HVP6_9EURY|nr:hypothetical protein [uncultured marine group II/III euryarchaeote KM3_87_G01]
MIDSEDLKIRSIWHIMGQVEVWDTLPTFEMWPEKTFFGLDKNAAHCFTLPKQMTDKIIRFYGLREGKLQVPITFLIEGRRYPAIVRWARMDRRNPIKLKKEDLPKRDVVQFGWKSSEITVSAIRIALQDAFEQVSEGKKNTSQSAIFVHTKDDEFCIYTSEN